MTAEPSHSDCGVSSKPYRSTPVFDELSLPQALRREHSTKAGVWGVVQVLEGEVELHFADGRLEHLNPGRPGLLRPCEVHFVEPVGNIKMKVDFYDREPQIRRS